MIRWFHVEPSSSCPSYTPGLYTAEQIDQLVFVDGYIPVASAAEFDAIRTGLSETMGAGTCWTGTYTTGLDKKYVQVSAITFTTTILSLSITSGFIYDGNELGFDDIRNGRIFTNIVAGSVVKNMRITSFGTLLIGFGANILTNINSGTIQNTTISASLSASGTFSGMFCAANTGLIEDCFATGDITGSISNSGLFLGNTASGTIRRCHSSGTITTTSSGASIGGFIGGQFTSSSTCLIENCYADVVVTGGTLSGGFFGNFSASGGNQTVRECYSIGNVVGLVAGVAGFGGQHRDGTTLIVDCWCSGNVSGTGTVSSGFIDQNYPGLTVTNCFCFNTVTGSTTNSGFCSRTTGTFNQSYFDETVKGDTVNAIAGLNQTTSALQTPTSNTGIYSAWSLAIWDFGTSVEYPELINTP